MLTFTAFEAKTRFDELLDRIAKGESVVITRHGRAIARMMPVGRPGKETTQEVVNKLLEFARGHRLGDSVRSLIDEGRR